MLDIAAVCLVVTALLAYLTHRFIGLPTSIGVMVSALALSLLMTLLLMILFTGIVIWAYSSKRRKRFDEAAQLPLEEDPGIEPAARRPEPGKTKSVKAK